MNGRIFSESRSEIIYQRKVAILMFMSNHVQVLGSNYRSKTANYEEHTHGAGLSTFDSAVHADLNIRLRSTILHERLEKRKQKCLEREAGTHKYYRTQITDERSNNELNYRCFAENNKQK